MKIFLDDKREMHGKHQFNCVTTYFQCVALIDAFKNIEVISLDYNLGVNSEYTGFDVLVYMHEHGIKPKHINIHSSHQVGAPKMREYAEKNFPDTIVTTNKIKVKN